MIVLFISKHLDSRQPGHEITISKDAETFVEFVSTQDGHQTRCVKLNYPKSFRLFSRHLRFLNIIVSSRGGIERLQLHRFEYGSLSR